MFPANVRGMSLKTPVIFGNASVTSKSTGSVRYRQKDMVERTYNLAIPGCSHQQVGLDILEGMNWGETAQPQAVCFLAAHQ